MTVWRNLPAGVVEMYTQVFAVTLRRAAARVVYGSLLGIALSIERFYAETCESSINHSPDLSLVAKLWRSAFAKQASLDTKGWRTAELKSTSLFQMQILAPLSADQP
jgi:hypothetical protein